MFVLAALPAVSLVIQSTTLSFKDGAFTLRDSRGQRTILDHPAEKKSTSKFSLNHKGTWIVWDERGLTRRTLSGAMFNTGFEEAATSLKLQTNDELMKTQAELLKGTRQRRASTIVGHELIGDDLYLLVQWQDKSGQTWLEGLFQMDLSAPAPKPHFVTRFSGSTIDPSVGDDILSYVGKDLVTVTKSNASWGISRWNVETNVHSFKALGSEVASASIASSGKEVLYAERSAYGTTLVGVVTSDGVRQKLLAESRGAIEFLSESPVLLALRNSRGTVLLNASTGSQFNVPKGGSFGATSAGVVVWTPAKNPNRAALFDPTRWTALATWQAPLATSRNEQKSELAGRTSNSRKPQRQPGKRGTRPPP